VIPEKQMGVFGSLCARRDNAVYRIKPYSQTEPVFISNVSLSDQIPKQSGQPQLEEEMECSKPGVLDLGVFV